MDQGEINMFEDLASRLLGMPKDKKKTKGISPSKFYRVDFEEGLSVEKVEIKEIDAKKIKF